MLSFFFKTFLIEFLFDSSGNILRDLNFAWNREFITLKSSLPLFLFSKLHHLCVVIQFWNYLLAYSVGQSEFSDLRIRYWKETFSLHILFFQNIHIRSLIRKHFLAVCYQFSDVWVCLCAAPRRVLSMASAGNLNMKSYWYFPLSWITCFYIIYLYKEEKKKNSHVMNLISEVSLLRSLDWRAQV